MMLTPRTPTGGDGTPQPARRLTALTAAHSKIPDALQTFRSREPKALGVALLMLGIILFVTVIPLIKTVPSVAIQNGAPFYAAVLLGISGSLAIVSEKHPGKVKLKTCLACTVLSAVVTAVQIVVYLVDLNKFKFGKAHCWLQSFDKECYRAATQQKQLFAYVPVFYLLTFSGMMLSIILSISLYDVLRSWNPELDRPVSPAMSTPCDPEGAALISVDQGYAPLEEPQRIPAPGPMVQRPTQPVGSGKTSLLVQKFLEAQPKMLGVVHIVLALCLILITMPYLILLTYEEIRLGIMWWLVIQCVVSGVLSIAAEDRPTINMIRACMALNIISATAASIGAIGFQPLASEMIFCVYQKCEHVLETIVAVFPLIFLLLSITISVVIATYARKSLRSMTLSKTTVVVNPPSAQDPRDEPVGAQ